MSDTLFRMAGEKGDQRMQAVALCNKLDFYYYQNKQLVIESGECVGCKLCQESCPESAIEVREEIAKKTQTHYSFNVAFCPRCQNPFPSLNPGEHLCPACSMQEKLRFTGDRIGMKSLNFSA